MRNHSFVIFINVALFLIISPYIHASGEIKSSIKGSVFIEYDDNITSLHSNEIDDFVTNISLGLELRKEDKMQDIILDANIQQELFADNSDFNNTSQDLRFKFDKEFTKHDRLSLENKFLHAENPRSIEDAFGRTTGLYRYYRNRFLIDYEKEFNPRIVWKTGYQNEVYEPSRPDIKDSLLHRLTLETALTHNPTTDFSLMYDFGVRNYEGGGEAYVHTLAAGMHKLLTGKLTWDTLIGASVIDSFENGDFTRPYIQISLTDDVSARSKLKLIFRNESFPDANREDIFDSWRFSAHINQKIYERLNVDLSAFYGEGEFLLQDIEDSLLGCSTQINYEITPDWEASVSYSFLNNDSNRSTRDYAKNVISTGVTYNF